MCMLYFITVSYTNVGIAPNLLLSKRHFCARVLKLKEEIKWLSIAFLNAHICYNPVFGYPDLMLRCLWLTEVITF